MIPNKTVPKEFVALHGLAARRGGAGGWHAGGWMGERMAGWLAGWLASWLLG